MRVRRVEARFDRTNGIAVRVTVSQQEEAMWPFRLPDPPDGFEREALSAHTFVERERGQWVVYLEVLFWDQTCRHRIATYRTERQARVAADWIRRGAQRELPRAPDGM
jgi:hypothetical protein